MMISSSKSKNKSEPNSLENAKEAIKAQMLKDKKLKSPAEELQEIRNQEKRELRELKMLSPQERRNILMKQGEYQMDDIAFSRFAQKNNDRRFKFSY